MFKVALGLPEVGTPSQSVPGVSRQFPGGTRRFARCVERLYAWIWFVGMQLVIKGDGKWLPESGVL